MIIADFYPLAISEKDCLHEVRLDPASLDIWGLSWGWKSVVCLVVRCLAWISIGVDLLGNSGVEMLRAGEELRHLHEFITTRAFCRSRVQHHPNHRVQILWILLWQSLVLAFEHALEQTLHVLRLKRRFQCYHFVDNAPERPEIAFEIVGFVAPHLGTRVVRCASLSIVQSMLICQLWNIHIAKFTRPVFIHEYIGRFDISMHNVDRVEGLESTHDLDE